MQVPTASARSASHGRAASGDERRRVAIPRRTTRGPLDHDDVIDDPLADSAPNLPARIASPSHASTTTTTTTTTPSPQPQTQQQTPPQSLHHGPARSALPDMPSKDFSFLQDPSAYHVLPATNVAPPFLNAPSIPSVSSPLDTLLLSGHYRLAAIAAARNIVTAAASTDYSTLFRLIHVRLACLCLISEHAIAAQESKVLGDLSSAFYLHPLTQEHLVPWDLRVLVVRLSALGYGEWRKGVMGYYELARECRERILRAAEEQEKELWRTRLRDCGIRVANVLVEMGDIEGAARHLESLSSDPSSTPEQSVETRTMEALVYLRIGDAAAAARALSASDKASPTLISGTLAALLSLADGDYTLATEQFTSLHTQHPSDAMITQNLAVCLLYTGKIQESRDLLSELVDSSPPFHSMVFNLCTVYELCTERNREKKLGLAEKLASRREGGGVGWEVGSGEFKL